jgi:inner membrane transporter RhtA
VGILVSIEPAMGAVLGLVFLDEHLSLLQWLAIVAVIIASIGAVLGARGVRRETVVPPESVPPMTNP